jgi:ribulose bisphosphate carboxylase small subunit
MPPALQDRFNQLLDHAKATRFRITAPENLAAAKEMVETLFHTGHLCAVEYRAYHEQITTIRIMVRTAELKRVKDLLEQAQQFNANPEGVRAAVSEDGAYRYNPLSGAFE